VKSFEIGLVGSPFAGRPFADNAQGISEAAPASGPRAQRRSATSGSLIVEPWQVLIK
jgi:hypothetical protein